MGGRGRAGNRGYPQSGAGKDMGLDETSTAEDRGELWKSFSRHVNQRSFKPREALKEIDIFLSKYRIV
jgi:hypothetical protein